jgi:hypothetical protein
MDKLGIKVLLDKKKEKDLFYFIKYNRKEEIKNNL